MCAILCCCVICIISWIAAAECLSDIQSMCSSLSTADAQVKDPTARVEHEASTSKIGEDQLFYFQQRGIDAEEAVATIISGFCADVFNKLPDEFAEEVNALMSLKLEGSVG